MTMTTNTVHPKIAVLDGVYAPQQDSALLIAALDDLAVAGRHVADLCTGSGVIAIAAAQRGASSVTGWDVCPQAVACTTLNAATADVAVDARLGNVAHVLVHGPYDVVTANPPYVPTPESRRGEVTADAGGPAWAFNAGPDGRLVLGELGVDPPSLTDDSHEVICGLMRALARPSEDNATSVTLSCAAEQLESI